VQIQEEIARLISPITSQGQLILRETTNSSQGPLTTLCNNIITGLHRLQGNSSQEAILTRNHSMEEEKDTIKKDKIKTLHLRIPLL
jgi:hypothetical protein